MATKPIGTTLNQGQEIEALQLGHQERDHHEQREQDGRDHGTFRFRTFLNCRPNDDL